MDQDDKTLLQRAAEGDRESLRILLQRFGPIVRDQIEREIGQIWRASLDADDVMQVSYLEAFMRQRSLAARTGETFKAWLGQIARNNLRDAIKELSRKKRPHPAHRVQHAAAANESYVAFLDVLSDGGETPSRHVARDEAAQVLRSLIERLPADYARVIQLYDLEGREIAEVAEVMERSVGAVHMLRFRAHDRLRDWIGAETNFFSQS
jgi:RNA polymerase sigma factor (sigma-70 family)